MCPRKKTTKSLAVSNLSFQAKRRPGTCNLWSRIQKSTPQQVAGDTRNSIRTASPARSQISKNAFHATRLSKLATSFSLVTHLDERRRRPESTTIRKDDNMSQTSTTNIEPMDVKLEVVILGVSDVDRAKAFYENLGWRV